jgi:DNA-binding transcriptional regulator YdaS (Cro superfamily)
VGGQRALARKLSVEAPTVNQWAKLKRPIPDEKCVGIELATEGEVACEELAPERHWVRVPDRKWPHPKGRPLIDHAPAANDSEHKTRA